MKHASFVLYTRRRSPLIFSNARGAGGPLSRLLLDFMNAAHELHQSTVPALVATQLVAFHEEKTWFAGCCTESWAYMPDLSPAPAPAAPVGAPGEE